jgi:hypothetical protein
MLHECDECGNDFDDDDEVECDFSVVEDGQAICALCNSDDAE